MLAKFKQKEKEYEAQIHGITSDFLSQKQILEQELEIVKMENKKVETKTTEELKFINEKLFQKESEYLKLESMEEKFFINYNIDYGIALKVEEPRERLQ